MQIILCQEKALPSSLIAQNAALIYFITPPRYFTKIGLSQVAILILNTRLIETAAI